MGPVSSGRVCEFGGVCVSVLEVCCPYTSCNLARVLGPTRPNPVVFGVPLDTMPYLI